MNKSMKIISMSAFALLLFFGISLQIFLKNNNEDKTAVYLSEVTISVSGLNSIYSAQGDSGAWGAVRGVGTFTQNVVHALDKILINLEESGALSVNRVLTHNNGTYKMRLDPNANATPNSAAFGTAKTYKYRLDLWSSAPGNPKVLELFFDGPQNKSEVLAIWRPKFFDPTNLTGNDAIMECAMTGGSASGTMVCSWSGGPYELDGPIDNGRIRATADSANGTVNVTALVRIATSFTAVCPLAPSTPSHTARDYFSLAFITKTKAPNQTTASFGVIEDGQAVDSICDVANPNNYGRFNTSVFAGASDDKKFYVNDGFTTDDPNYPLIADVSALHSTINGSDTDLSVGDLDAISTAFDSTAAPGF